MPACVVCDDRGCEHCPRADGAEGAIAALRRVNERTQAYTVVDSAVRLALSVGVAPDGLRWAVEDSMSRWADDQGEPPVVTGEVRLDRWGKPC